MSQSNKFPLSGLLALALTGFIAIMTETVPAGLLPNISRDLHVSASLAGQLITLYAIGSIIAAIPIISLTKHWSRKRLLLTAVTGFLLFNALTAVAPNYAIMLIARLLVGLAAGVTWGMLAGYARRMVTAAQSGRGMAIAMLGTPVALSFGVPLGTLLGNLIGWRLVFGLMTLVTVFLLIWLWRALPDFPGQTNSQAMALTAVLRLANVKPILAVVLFWLGAHNLFYTYIAPFLTAHGHLKVDLALLIFGIASIISIFITGALIDRYLRQLTLISLIGFSAVALALMLTTAPALLYAEVALWGLSFGGAATLLQTALAANVPDSALDAVMAMNATIWNISIALGGLLGGLLLNQAGALSLTWPFLFSALLALIIVWHWRKTAFSQH
jgi:predicted MFS family arabinose efflux permease